MTWQNHIEKNYIDRIRIKIRYERVIINKNRNLNITIEENQ